MKICSPVAEVTPRCGRTPPPPQGAGEGNHLANAGSARIIVRIGDSTPSVRRKQQRQQHSTSDKNPPLTTAPALQQEHPPHRCFKKVHDGIALLSACLWWSRMRLYGVILNPTSEMPHAIGQSMPSSDCVYAVVGTREGSQQHVNQTATLQFGRSVHHRFTFRRSSCFVP